MDQLETIDDTPRRPGESTPGLEQQVHAHGEQQPVRQVRLDAVPHLRPAARVEGNESVLLSKAAQARYQSLDSVEDWRDEANGVNHDERQCGGQDVVRYRSGKELPLRLVLARVSHGTMALYEHSRNAAVHRQDNADDTQDSPRGECHAAVVLSPHPRRGIPLAETRLPRQNPTPRRK